MLKRIWKELVENGLFKKFRENGIGIMFNIALVAFDKYPFKLKSEFKISYIGEHKVELVKLNEDINEIEEEKEE